MPKVFNSSSTSWCWNHPSPNYWIIKKKKIDTNFNTHTHTHIYMQTYNYTQDFNFYIEIGQNLGKYLGWGLWQPLVKHVILPMS